MSSYLSESKCPVVHDEGFLVGVHLGDVAPARHHCLALLLPQPYPEDGVQEHAETSEITDSWKLIT